MAIEGFFKRNFGSRKSYDLGIALGGGGARGFAHLGVIEALKEKGIEAEIYSGVSAGSIVGAFLASGKKPREVFDIMKTRKFFQYAGIRIPKHGLLTLTGLKEDLEKNIKEEKIEDLEIPLLIGAVNLNHAELEYFDSGPLSKIVMASSSIPILFAPVEMNGSLYCDGGLFQNIPVDPLKEQCRKVIAVNVSPVADTDRLNNLVQIATRIFHLSVEANSRNIEEQCDLLIEPEDLHEYDILETKHADELFEIGYEYTKSMKISL
jgi:NTE family protein